MGRPLSSHELNENGCAYLVAAILHQACLDAVAAMPTFVPNRRKKKKGKRIAQSDIEHQCACEIFSTIEIRLTSHEFIYSPDSKHLAEQIGWNLWPPSPDDLAAFAQSRRMNGHKF